MDIVAYFNNTRLLHWWWWIGVCAIAAYISGPGVAPAALVLVLSGFSFLFASVHALNNTCDHASDRGHSMKRNPVAQGKISLRGSVAESVVLALGGLVFLGLVSPGGLLGGVLLCVLSVVYQVPPLRTKARPYLDVVTITFLYSTPFLIGYAAVGAMDLKGLSIAFLFGLISGTVHPLQTAKDIDSDSRNGDVTISVLLGIERSVIFSLVLFVSTLAYFELLVMARILDPELFFVPVLAVPSLFHYRHALEQPSDERIGTAWRRLRLNAIVVCLIMTYMTLV